MRPVPAESPQLKSKVERSIDFFKDHFVRVDKQVGLTRHDDPHVWCSHIAFACNTHFRKSGFSPYMFVLGHAPKVPTSLTENFLGDQRRLAAHSSVLFDKGPRRAEQMSSSKQGVLRHGHGRADEKSADRTSPTVEEHVQARTACLLLPSGDRQEGDE